MGDLEFRGVMFTPHLITGRACENHPLCPFLTDGLQVVFHECLIHLFQARAQHGKPTAPFFLTQQGKIDFAHVQDLCKGYGYLLGQREIGGHAACEIDHLCLILEIPMIWGVSHVIHPVGALFVVFRKDVVALLQVFPDHLNFLWVGIRMNQVLA